LNLKILQIFHPTTTPPSAQRIDFQLDLHFGPRFCTSSTL
jgi:hypothetical protein